MPPIEHVTLAFDLGASSSRASLGVLEADRLYVEEIHRFETPIVERGEHLRWDLRAIDDELRSALDRALRERPDLNSVSVDSWAVDFVRLDEFGSPLMDPFCYRDPRTRGMMDAIFELVTPEVIYRTTGIQFMEINTLVQLFADSRQRPDLVGRTAYCLPIADYFNYRFSGRAFVELSMASATQIMDATSRDWAGGLLGSLGLRSDVWPEIVAPGTVIGPLRRQRNVAVVAGCSHDTACAVAAVPARTGPGITQAETLSDDGDETDRGWAYLSCGTWSLLGVERSRPLLTDDARQYGFTNEVGLGGSIRLLKNVNGLWTLQECEREWRAAGMRYTYDELLAEAAQITFTDGIVDVDDPRLKERGDMPGKIRASCREAGLAEPTTRGEFTRRILDGLADRHRVVLQEAEQLAGRRIETLHVVGGGSQNELLCRLTAEACGRSVVAGPAEATMIGNHLVQAAALGALPEGVTVRDVVKHSCEMRPYQAHGPS